MKKKVISRILLGAPLGIAVCYIITLIVSVCIGDGNYYPVHPALINDFGSEINAALIQTSAGMIIGALYAGTSVIWEMEKWSILRMTLTHLLATSVPVLPLAWLMRWVPRTAAGVLVYLAIFFGIYLLIWLIQYAVMKKKISAMNKKLME